ncbi:MAG TPA: BTAD domain-containing putative transcriptional regulator [Gaiellaceae bacterium]|nr:BTAD domain-containing putative transcriptional regulator [Gaiellaceae bacterium]
MSDSIGGVRCRNLGDSLATRIHLCGRLTVEVDGRQAEKDLPGRQGRLLFAYLVLNRRRPVRRDELTGALWHDKAPAAPAAALSALLSKLRRLIPLEGRSELRLLLPADAWIDVEAVGEALHRAEGAVARHDWSTAWGPARVVQHIAARELLHREEAPWLDEHRRRLRDAYERALELAAQACLEIGGSELDTAERAARTLVAVAPYRESGYRWLMLTLERRGNRAEALRVYGDLRGLLREELGVAPSPATQELHRTLLGTSP